MEKIISDSDFNRILVQSYAETYGKNLNEEFFYELLEKSINEELPSERLVSEIEIVERTKDKWSVILTLDNDEETLYSIDLKTFLK